MTEPSKVIHVRNVGQEISENDLLQLLQPFGVVTKLVMLRAKNQALLQMYDISSAASALQYYSNVQPSVRGRNVYMQFSSHQELTTVDQGSQGRKDQDLDPNRILLATIHHMLYPITVEVLHQVFSPHGFVEKIVTFQKSAGFQALIQYQSLQCAVLARNTLQGRNIYDGCCQLDIQYSNLNELQVNYNNDRSRDFTNPSLPSEQRGRSSQLGYGDAGGLYALHPSGGRAVTMAQMNNAAAVAAAFGSGLPPGISGSNDRCTILVSNLNTDKVDEDKLFNLFSMYGNIVRIKLLHNKPDHALVEMGDGFQRPTARTFNLLFAAILGHRGANSYVHHLYMDALRSLFRQMVDSGVAPDIYALNAMIKGYVLSLHVNDALRIFHQMVPIYGVEPDEHSYSYLVHGLCSQGRTLNARELYVEMRGKGLVPTGRACNSLVSVLAMAGEVDEAVAAMWEGVGMRRCPDFITCRTVVEEICRQQRAGNAVVLLREMRQKEVINGQCYKKLLTGIGEEYQD